MVYSQDIHRQQDPRPRQGRREAQDKRPGELLAELNKAVAAANAAEAAVETAKTELVSRSKAVGLLLLEAKKLHPAVKDFEAFLQHVDGLKRSRAYDLLRLAGGRTTDEEIRQATRERVQKHRAAKKLPRPAPARAPATTPAPEPASVSVTSPDVTESAEDSAEKREAEYADFLTTTEKAQKASARYLAEFTTACRTYLPKLSADDARKAEQLVHSMINNLKRKAA